MDCKFRELTPDEIKVRVQMVRENGCSLLLYFDKTTAQNILDESVGPMNWRNSFQEINGSLYCLIEIYDDDKKEWVGKSLNGSASDAEAEKGQAADAMKRACGVWGIGRELTTAPKFMWVNARDTSIESYMGKYRCKDTFAINAIELNDKREISYISIKNSNGHIVYSYGRPSMKQTAPAPKAEEPAPEEAPKAKKATKKPNLDALRAKCEAEGISTKAVAAAHNKSSISQLTDNQAKAALEHWEKVVEKCGDVIPD
jgi:hypothetical protein